ncbi:putative transcription factor cmr1 protein [Neofusicoccum parvum UCRNP2]|uniref:Putative transcription factor cmr1 protein n=1 Tax=Botryosphaeria parva (strain UCR-NP2) TaxID=1287680 RepID=R1GIM5_BOTPV|nr:putative transcription factor cmr1 protein [Neofusicoccum parvum UCRNP2]
MTIYCTYCGHGFSRTEHLERHLLIHNDARPFRCETCHLSFRRRHMPCTRCVKRGWACAPRPSLRASRKPAAEPLPPPDKPPAAVRRGSGSDASNPPAAASPDLLLGVLADDAPLVPPRSSSIALTGAALPVQPVPPHFMDWDGFLDATPSPDAADDEPGRLVEPVTAEARDCLIMMVQRVLNLGRRQT